MTDDTGNLILEQFRLIRAQLNEVRDDIREQSARIGDLEQAVVGVKRDLAHQFEMLIHQQAGFERVNNRLARIERRLDIVEA